MTSLSMFTVLTSYGPRIEMCGTPTPCSMPAAGKNFVRGVILGMIATFFGILLFSFPEYVQQIFRIQLPIPPGTIVSV